MALSSRDCFIRLDRKFDVEALHLDCSHWEFKGRYAHPTKYGVAYKKKVEYEAVPPELHIVQGKTRTDVLSWLPAELLNREDPEIVFIYVPPHESGAGMFAPHVDGFRIACVNFYVDDDEEVTRFYDYSGGGMIGIGEFSAKKGDCWVLNTTIPHSVSLSSTKPRRVVSVSFVDTPFHQLVQLLTTGATYVQETHAQD